MDERRTHNDAKLAYVIIPLKWEKWEYVPKIIKCEREYVVKIIMSKLLIRCFFVNRPRIGIVNRPRISNI